MHDYSFASIHEIHKQYQEKQLTVRNLVLMYLERIAKIDKCQDGLNSVLEINPDALFIADTLDKKLSNLNIFNIEETLSPLFGIPVLLKDNINTADRLHTSASADALKNNYAPCDAHIVKLLREAGAVILGKVNMTEFANYMSRETMPAGYGSRGGQVFNPYNRDVHPGGSSSGSGVAVAAGLCTVSIGTETAGSIISPSMQNGIVGIKPTLGLVSRSGIIPISGTLDSAGPMTRTVSDAAILLSVIAGADPSDPESCAQEKKADYSGSLDPDGLKGIRVGIYRSQEHHKFSLSEEERGIFDNFLKVITEAGAILTDNIILSNDYQEIRDIMRYEFKACMNYYLSTLSSGFPLKTLKDIIEYNQANAQVALKYGQTLLIDAENNTSGTMTEPEYYNILEKREQEIIQLDKVFNDNDFDVILCEVLTNAAPFSGFPSMSIPIGQKSDKMPLGSYWIARRYDEATLIKVTYAVEQALGLCIRPKLT